MLVKFFEKLERINERPQPFEFYTARELWNDEHTSEKMLSFHLNKDIDVSSRSAKFVDRSVKWIVSRFGIGEGKKIADFGCGPGLYATGLAKRGAMVTGVDFSKRSIEYAREVANREGLNIHYANRDYLEWEPEDRYDLVLMIMCDLCALSPAQRKKILTKFRNILNPGGSVLLDAYSLASFRKREEGAIYEPNLLNGFWSPNRYYGFLNTFKYEREKVILEKYTIVESERIRTIYNWLQYFTPENIEKEFAQCGLSIENFFSDVAGSPYDEKGGEFAVIAKKRK